MILFTAYSRLSDTSTLAGDNRFYRQCFLTICCIYLITAGLLAVLVQYGVMDEDFHLVSSRPFIDNGLTSMTLYRHIPPTGVASHIWYALWAWLFPGINYIGLRLITCAVITMLAGFAYWHLRTISISSQRKVLAASWFMLVSPYFFLSISTAMTEGPALMFLFAGLLLLLVSRLQHLLPLLLACLLLGVATIARFYFISLLPTLFIVLVLSDWEQYEQRGFQGTVASRALPYVFIGVGLLPLTALIFLWSGLTPPAFNHWSQMRSGVSFNALRPLSALAILGVYIAPIVVFNVSWTSKSALSILRVVVPVALVLAAFQVNLFHTSTINSVFSGPIEHSLDWIKRSGELAFALSLFIVYSISFFSLVIVILRVSYLIRIKDFSDKGLLFSVVFVLLFIVSQAFIGGNQPFYERYLIHPWPFTGYILASIFPAFLNSRTYLVLAAYSALSVAILIKWGIH